MNGDERQGMARNGQNNRFSNGMAVNPTNWWVRLHSKVASLTASLLIGRSRHTFFRNAANKNGEIYDVHIYLSQLFSLFVKTI